MVNKFKGTGVALVTPFNDDLSVDYAALGQLVKHVSDGGVDYLVVMGTTAEAPTLTSEEKLEVLRFVKSKNDKNLPIIYGMGGNNTALMIEQFKSFQEDVDAILVVCPFYNKPNQTGLKAHFEAIADVSPRPIMLYNVPKRTGVNLEASTVLSLADHDNIIGIKEASGGDVSQCKEIAEKMPSDFILTSGDDDLIPPFIAAGGQGVISVIANGLPKETSDLVKFCLANKSDEAQNLFGKMEVMMNLIFSEGNPTGIKSLLASLGVITNDVLRLPLVKASTTLTEKIKSAL